MEILKVKETAAYLRCCEKTVLKLFRAKKIKAFKVGYEWRVLKSELEKYMKCIEDT